jgi:hypothetical protein
MAKAQKTGRKFGRNKNRPSGKMYNAQSRAIVNKLRKVKKHVKNNPNDQYAASVLKNNGSMGPAEYPAKPAPKQSKVHESPTVAQDFRGKETWVLSSSSGTTLDVGTSEKEMHEVATCGKYHLAMNLYHQVGGKLFLVKHYPGTKVPVSRKDLLQALKNQR